MQKLAEVCIKRPVFATMLVMAFVVVGAASWFRLGVDRFPAVDLPTVNVRVELPGASTEEVETQVAQKLEEQINTIQGINELRSISGSGAVIIIVTFNLNRQIDVAAQDVRDKVAIAVRNLPREILPPVVSKFDNDQAPVVTIALSGERSLRELTEIADKTARPLLERSSGVGEVRIVGGLPRAVSVWVDPDRLAAYQIPITSVRDAIVRQNADLPGGNVTAGLNESSLRTMGRIADPRAFNDLVVATLNGVPVRVLDIGYAEDGTKEQRSAARLNGVPTVIMEVRRQSGENTVAVIEGVKTRLAALRRQTPPDVTLAVIRDQSRYIYAALHEINLHLVLGSILASLVVLAFMRSWRSTFIAAVAIPTSVVSAFGMMWALNFTLNSVTMLVLVLMVGIVIDDAIVVLENVFRFVEEKKMRPFEAAREATADIGLAVMATTFSLVVIFVPVSFMSSISGRFLYQFGLTAAASVLVSLLVSFSLTPMMCARLLRAEDAASGHAEGAHAGSRGGFYAWIDRAYTWSLAWSMRHRWVIVIVSVVTLVAAMPIYRQVKQEYIPSAVDESEFEVLVFGPEKMSLAAMDEAMQALAKEARETERDALPLARLLRERLHGLVHRSETHLLGTEHEHLELGLVDGARDVLLLHLPVDRHGRDQGHHADDHDDPAMPHRPGEAPRVGPVDPGVEAAARARVRALGVTARSILRPQQPGAHHRGQRERHQQAHQHRRRGGEAELVEEPAGDRGHERDRHEDDDQREGRGHDGQPDVRGGFPRGLEGPHLLFLDEAEHVLEDDDGIVDDDADHQHQHQHRHAVEREVQRPHHAERRDDRGRDGHRGDERGAPQAHERQHHQRGQNGAEHQVQVDLVEGRVDVARLVADHFQLDVGRDLIAQARQLRLHALDHRYRVLARLPAHLHDDRGHAV